MDSPRLSVSPPSPRISRFLDKLGVAGQFLRPLLIIGRTNVVTYSHNSQAAYLEYFGSRLVLVKTGLVSHL